jgi:hypothetical protein
MLLDKVFGFANVESRDTTYFAELTFEKQPRVPAAGKEARGQTIAKLDEAERNMPCNRRHTSRNIS